MPCGCLLPSRCHSHPHNARTLLLVNWYVSLQEMVGASLPQILLASPAYTLTQQLQRLCQRQVLWASTDDIFRNLLHSPFHGSFQPPRGHFRCHHSRIPRRRLCQHPGEPLHHSLGMPAHPFAPSQEPPCKNYSAYIKSRPVPTTLPKMAA